MVDGFHQVTHDVELIEHQYRLGRSVLDDVDVRLPHMAANTFERSRFLRSEDVEERLDGLPGCGRWSRSMPRPNQPSGSVQVGERPWGLAISPDGAHLYTANGPSNDVSVVGTSALEVVVTIPEGERPWGVAVVLP